jgi:PII-like signaling protein
MTMFRDQEDQAMKTSGRMLRLSIFIDESDRWHNKPLYSEIVHRAHEAGLAGATVIRGIEGYGETSRIHATHVFKLSEDLPLLILIADTEERVREFLPKLDEFDISGLVVIDPVETVQYRHPEQKHTHWWSAN